MYGRQLTVGKLLDLGITDGSELTLVPVIEAGFLVSKPICILEQTVALHVQNCFVLCVLHSVRLPGLKEARWTFWKV